MLFFFHHPSRYVRRRSVLYIYIYFYVCFSLLYPFFLFENVNIFKAIRFSWFLLGHVPEISYIHTHNSTFGKSISNVFINNILIRALIHIYPISCYIVSCFSPSSDTFIFHLYISTTIHLYLAIYMYLPKPKNLYGSILDHISKIHFGYALLIYWLYRLNSTIS